VRVLPRLSRRPEKSKKETKTLEEQERKRAKNPSLLLGVPRREGLAGQDF
jgi:hypothetical protein